MKIPTYYELIKPTFLVLKTLGDSGTNEEIHNKIIIFLNLPDSLVDESHLGSKNMSELQYRLAWARTYLKNYGAIENSARGVWSITPKYAQETTIDEKKVIDFMVKKSHKKVSTVKTKPEDTDPDNNNSEFPEEVKPWRIKLAEILKNMNPYSFEKLSQRLLRECGFSQVEVTKKSGDGGIDGTGKLRINGIFSFNVAFQCKRYRGQVGAGDIRDFRGSLTTDIEKGVLITTGTFSQKAREEATNPGKQQIDLIDGEEFITKLAEYGIGVREIKEYVIDQDFFNTFDEES